MKIIGTRMLWTAMSAVLLAGCATPGPRERMAHRLALYTEAAGEPVDSIRYWQLHRWEPLGDAAVGVWTRPDRAYLITLQRPCFGLDYTPVIALTSSMHRIDRRFDTLRFENSWCRFEEFRPVDVKRLRALTAADDT